MNLIKKYQWYRELNLFRIVKSIIVRNELIKKINVKSQAEIMYKKSIISIIEFKDEKINEFAKKKLIHMTEIRFLKSIMSPTEFKNEKSIR